MPNYSPERKQAVIVKMLPPINASVPELSVKEGICSATLYYWRKQALKNNSMENDNKNAGNWSSSKKFQAVLDTATMSQQELSAYCRQHGIYPEQLADWKAQCMSANSATSVADKGQKKKEKSYQKQVRQLEKELRRKDKALAEAAALLVLQKKFNAMLGADEEE